MKKLPTSVKINYALGQLGWSILNGLIMVWLVWFYNPSSDVSIPQFIPRGAVFGFLTVIGLITMFGRLTDAVTDPLIASLSDQSKNPKGRRIPFMAKAILPFSILTVAVFFMPTAANFTVNVIWLTVTLLAFYWAFTMYVAPYFALTAELGYSAKDRMDLSTYIALTWFLGYIIASSASFIWPIFEGMGFTLVTSIRISIVILAVIGTIFCLVPVLTIEETKYVTMRPAPKTNFMKSAFSTFKNKNFLVFEIFFLAYGIAITIFQTGNVYYVTVLLELEPSWVMVITALTGILAFTLYPLVNIFSRRVGKKVLCIFAMVMLIIAYIYCAFLGTLPFSPLIQGLIFVFFAGIGFAIFGILPNAIVADIATVDGKQTGEYKEGTYFAVQTFMNKLGQMIAMVIFSSILLLGQDIGDDLGIRMTGIIAAIIGFVALMIFLRFEEVTE